VTIKNRVLETLEHIEKDHNVNILYSAEVGSRIYGYESNYSDYDVKFIYVRPIDWYLHLNIENKSDTIIKTKDNLDLVGWDIRKVLKLLAKSNTSLIEWFNSTIVYKQEACMHPSFIRELINEYYRLNSGVYHYKGMAITDIKKYRGYDEVPIKLYINILRCITSALYITKTHSFPPLKLEDAFDTVIDNDQLREEIQCLLNIRRQSGPTPIDYNSVCMDKFIMDSLDSLRTFDERVEKNKDLSLINEVFSVLIGYSK